MLKKVLSVVLALVLALGVLAVATSAASASDLQTALNSLPSEYNAQFYNESTQAAILEARNIISGKQNAHLYASAKQLFGELDTEEE